MKRILLLGVSLVLAVSSLASADDAFKAEYISGKAGYKDKIKGQLIVGAQALTFMDGDKTIFTVPIASVTKASNAVENNTGGLGRKVMFGNYSNRSEGFVYVTTETADVSEGLVFKVDQKAPAGIVAKIEFAVKKAKGE